MRAKLWAGKKRYLLLFQEAAIMDKKLAYFQEKAREKAREESAWSGPAGGRR